MSTGKRLAKRSIIGTRVCAPAEDGKFYSGVIHAVKTPGVVGEGQSNPGETRYSVRFDKQRSASTREYRETELVGPGFQPVTGFKLQPGQRVYLTYNGREVSGEVELHQPAVDELVVKIQPPGHEDSMELRKKLEEIRLLESRKSARLMDQDTDFARLADMAGDRKRTSSHSIDVPTVHGSRKRRPSFSQDEEDYMDECTAALVLMSLSCSPHSPNFNGLWRELSRRLLLVTPSSCLFAGVSWSDHLSPSPGSDALSWRSATPSPPLSEGGASTSTFWSQVTTDEGIVIDDYDELPRKKKASRMVFQCTWPGCGVVTNNCVTIEAHVRKVHLGPRKTVDDSELSDHEEEFYYMEVEQGPHTSSPPTLSHRDMARPPHEDPEYQKQIKSILQESPVNTSLGGISWSSSTTSPSSPQKHLKLSSRSYLQQSGASLLSLSAPNKSPSSPTRKSRGETKKCRKVYGMDHRDSWCTQCKWKKACSRFND